MCSYKIRFKNKTKIVVLDGSKEIGYLNFDYADDASKKRNIEISYMYVNPKNRKMGIGSKMIEFLIKNKPKVTWISLWTGKEIEKMKATNFYLKNKFKKLAHQEDYYEKGTGTTLFVRRLN
jgi:ribosomal protein S18 acetylase RimI-like enzyme